jgi:hypothetical protein
MKLLVVAVTSAFGTIPLLCIYLTARDGDQSMVTTIIQLALATGFTYILWNGVRAWRIASENKNPV